MLAAIISLIFLLFSSFILVRIFNTIRIYEKVLLFFTVSTGQTIVLAHILSWRNLLSNTLYWAIGNVTILMIIISILAFTKQLKGNIFFLSKLPSMNNIKVWYVSLTKTQRVIIVPTFGIALFIGFIDLLVVLFTMTNHWDSLSYHLPRVAYYLQHGNLDYFPANYWAQVVHVKNSAILMLYIFLVSGRTENLMQSLQFVSYIVSLFAVYGISRRIGLERIYALSASLIYSLFIEVLLESVTPQNDLVITAYTGIAVYFLLAYKEQSHFRNILAAFISIGIGLGVKFSFLTLLPSLALIALYALKDRNLFSKKFTLSLCFSLGIIFIVFILPSGYLENYLLFQNPFGPKDALSHSYAGRSIPHILKDGSLNLIRYTMDSLSLDGLPGKTSYDKLRQALLERSVTLPEKNPFFQLQTLLRFVPVKLIQMADLPVESASDYTFNLAKTPRADEDVANLGVLGFGLLWVSIILLLFNVIKSPGGRLLSFAAVLFFIVQCFVGRYDPWRGRYFIYSAVFAAPAIGCFIKTFENKKMIRIYILSILFLGWISAIGAAGIRQGPRLWTALHTSDRIAQMSLNYEVFHRFEELVPKDATVAVYFPEASLEYQLFGDKFTRTIIPVRPFRNENVPLSHKADYLIYQKDETISQEKNDIYLGKERITNCDYYLRKLSKKRGDAFSGEL